MKRQDERITLNQALEIFEENLPEIEQAANENMGAALAELEQPKPNIHPSLFWVKANVYLLRKEKIINQYKPVLRAIELRKQPRVANANTITQEHIDRAKTYPIENMLPEPPKRNMALCPLHNEKTPSFQIRKDNTFICWGCQQHGDAIDLYRFMHNTDFLTAVKALQ